jgi:uncharacterized membrane protein
MRIITSRNADHLQMFIFYFIYGFFNDAVSNSNYTVLKYKIINTN